MSNVVKYGNKSVTREVGGGMAKTGMLGGGLWILAGVLPFITFPMLVVLAIIGGGLLWLKG